MRLLFTALACCFLFSSCNPDEELTENGDVFIGTWKLHGSENSNGIFTIEDDACISQTGFIFEPDGDLIGTQYYWENEVSNTTCLSIMYTGQHEIINESIVNLTIFGSTTIGEISNDGNLKVQVLPFQGNYLVFEKIN